MRPFRTTLILLLLLIFSFSENSKRAYDNRLVLYVNYTILFEYFRADNAFPAINSNQNLPLIEKIRRNEFVDRLRQKRFTHFGATEIRLDAISPMMNLMGMALSMFGNFYPARSLANDDGSTMNETDIKNFRSSMNSFQPKFSSLGDHLTAVIENSRDLRNSFDMLSRKIANRKATLRRQKKSRSRS